MASINNTHTRARAPVSKCLQMRTELSRSRRLSDLSRVREKRLHKRGRVRMR